MLNVGHWALFTDAPASYHVGPGSSVVLAGLQHLLLSRGQLRLRQIREDVPHIVNFDMHILRVKHASMLVVHSMSSRFLHEIECSALGRLS